MSNVQINPKWLAWNAVQNDGGEGYNPYPKWIAKAVSAAAPRTISSTGHMLRDQSGNLIPEAKLRASLEKAEARLSVITDTSARAITEQAIAHARQQLGI